MKANLQQAIPGTIVLAGSQVSPGGEQGPAGVGGGSAPPPIDSTIIAALPVGSVISFAGSIIEEDWLVCDGSAVSRTTYPDLYATVGDTYGAGDGSTTFNLPDIRGKTIVGSGTGTGLTARSIGDIGGEETHIVSIAEMPIHTHIQDAHTHTQNPHNHVINGYQSLLNVSAGTLPHWGWGGGAYVNDGVGVNQNSVATNQNAGEGLAHNNMPPYIVLIYAIKAIKDSASSGGGGEGGETYVVRTVPIGTIVNNASATLHDGWLVCDGSGQDPATYPELFTAIGTTYGGDGTTIFNLPNFRDRVALGVSSTRTLGSIGGEETHVISVAEMPVHTHIQDAHMHTLNQGAKGWAEGGVTGSGNTEGAWGSTTNQTATNQNTGGGLAHNNIQPYLAVGYVIKAKEIEAIIDVVEDAPIDDLLYGRRNSEWEVISEGGGGGNVGIIDGSEPAVGEVGEVLKSEIRWSHSGFTNATDQTVKILTLDVPAGDWLVWGYVDVLWTFGHTMGPEQPPMEKGAGTLLTAPANGFIDVFETAPGVQYVPHIHSPFCTNLSAINASPSNARAGCVIQTKRLNSSSLYTFNIYLHMVMHFPAAPTMVGDYYGAPMLLAGIYARRMR
jgi:microcystin-dependent protein